MLVVSAATFSFAQGVYAGIGGGYGFPAGVQGYAPTETIVNPTTDNFTSKSYSLGAGGNFMFYGGYMFTKNIGAELEFSIPLTSSTSSTSTSSDSGISNSTSTSVETTKGSIFRIVPAMRFQVGDGNLHPFMVVGLILGISPSATDEQKTTDGSGNISDQITTYSGGMPIGFHGALGVQYQISTMIGIYAQLSADYQNWAPSKGLITTSTDNGSNQLSKMTTSQTETDYVSSGSYINKSPGNPTQSPLKYLPFSSFGIQAGIAFSFGGGSK